MTDLLNGVADACYPVGRLDYDSEGLLILTNDGEFSQRLQHPRYGIPKTYRVKVEGHLLKGEIQSPGKRDRPARRKICTGRRSSRKDEPGKHLAPADHYRRKKSRDQAGFRVLGHPVCRLVRVAVGDITLDALREGAWRRLTRKEVDRLLAQAGAYHRWATAGKR